MTDDLPPLTPNRLADGLARISALMSKNSTLGFAEVLDNARRARDEFHQLLAEQLADPLNCFIRNQNCTTLIRKQAISNLVNAQLRALGLAIECPRTGLPANLRGARDHESSEGRFQLELLVSAAQSRQRTVSSRDIPTLRLMVRPERREAGPQIGWRSKKRSTWSEFDRDQGPFR